MPESAGRRRHGLRRTSLRVVRVVSAIVVGLIAWRALDGTMNGNLGAVVPFEAYRSGQFSPDQLRAWTQEIPIRSVVNLRGASSEPWYREEVAACADAGIAHYDIAMSAREIPRPDAVLRLVQVLHDAPRPVLMHCGSGSDRSGMAAAVFLVTCKGVPPSDAWGRGLALWYGHLAVGRKGELDRFLSFYCEEGAGKSLEQWVREDYPATFKLEWSPVNRTEEDRVRIGAGGGEVVW
jgi:protein tyrosine phosphatase (PTP) superfamily phosphohydrolase (DUF442 family)